jgi:hypothetical protein
MHLRLAAVTAVSLLAACGPGRSPSTFNPVVILKGPGEACSATSQCQTSLVCRSGACATLAAAASCPSPGTAPNIVADSTVQASAPDPGVCVSSIQTPTFLDATDIVVQDLGEHLVDDLVLFDISTGTTSFTIFSQEVGGTAVDEIFIPSFAATVPNVVVPDLVKTPDGTVYYDDNKLSLSADVVFLGFSPVSGAFTSPNTSAGLETARNGRLPAGTWSLTANDWANECAHNRVPGLTCTPARNTGRYHLHAASKVAPVAATGALDVEVYLLLDPAATATTTAAQAAADPTYRRWATSLTFWLSRAGLCVGNVTFHDLPDWVHARYPNGHVDIDGDGPCGPLPQLFTTAVVKSRGVQIFLVDDLTVSGTAQSGSNTIVGVDGSIPGPSGLPGTINSGAVVGLFGTLGAGTCPSSGNPTLACGTDLVAYVAAHEIGHWLGLSHTTEESGTSFDVLSDTPQCPCSQCALPTTQRASCSNGSVEVTAAMCRASTTCGGGDNLMFWLVDHASAGTLSRDQGQVMRLNPAVR